MRNGVITGEGPTTKGRIHFSRTIDSGDTALITRILHAGNDAVSRAEAEALFEIHEAAFERADHGQFDDLFAKAIAHHVMAAAGRPVPPRAVALAPATALADWAAPDQFAIGGEVAGWLETRMRRKGRPCAPLAALAAMIGFATSVGGLGRRRDRFRGVAHPSTTASARDATSQRRDVRTTSSARRNALSSLGSGGT